MAFKSSHDPFICMPWLMDSLFCLEAQVGGYSLLLGFTLHSFFISIGVNWVEAQYASDFPNLSLKLCLMICLISKLISWSEIVFDRNTAMVSFKCSNLSIQLSLT